MSGYQQCKKTNTTKKTFKKSVFDPVPVSPATAATTAAAATTPTSWLPAPTAVPIWST
jgi:hypothetical protein